MSAVWAQSRDTLGDSDRNTLTALWLLGVAERRAGHMEIAEVHIDAARTGLARGYGEDSSDALASRTSQALNWLAHGAVRGGHRRRRSMSWPFTRGDWEPIIRTPSSVG